MNTNKVNIFRKVAIYFGMVSIIVIMSLGIFVSNVSASPNSYNNYEESLENFPDTRSMEVSEVRNYYGIITPPSSILYNKNNYSGTLYRDYYIHDYSNNITIAVYSGTVWCQGTCPMIGSVEK